VTDAEKILKEKEPGSTIMSSDIPYDYLPGWMLSGFTPSSPSHPAAIPPKKIKFDISTYISSVVSRRDTA
jgi:hypothetical protein